MNETAGKVFSIASDNMPVPGCTVSRMLSSDEGYFLSYFSLAEGTDISPETYDYHKLWIASSGEMTVVGSDHSANAGQTLSGTAVRLGPGQIYITPAGAPVGVRADKDSVYTELSLRKDSNMNKILEAGKVFELRELVPYQDGKVVNMDLINDDKLKLVVMSFDAGTGLPEHAAPGEALIFALDGEALIGYEGKQHRIRAGENFKFDKLGKHSVTAAHRFKMALLLQLG